MTKTFLCFEIVSWGRTGYTCMLFKIQLLTFGQLWTLKLYIISSIPMGKRGLYLFRMHIKVVCTKKLLYKLRTNIPRKTTKNTFLIS